MRQIWSIACNIQYGTHRVKDGDVLSVQNSIFCLCAEMKLYSKNSGNQQKFDRIKTNTRGNVYFD